MPALDLSMITWRKSSRSNDGGDGNCVEVGFVPDALWHKSSHSNHGGDGDCVEIAYTGVAVAMRDSRNTTGPLLAFDSAAWRGFLARHS